MSPLHSASMFAISISDPNSKPKKRTPQQRVKRGSKTLLEIKRIPAPFHSAPFTQIEVYTRALSTGRGSMFAKIFRSCKGESISSSDQLKQALETLQKKEMVLQKKISTEEERAKELNKSRNKEALSQCLKRKKYYEGQMEQLGIFQMRIHDQEKKQSLVKMASSKNSL